MKALLWGLCLLLPLWVSAAVLSLPGNEAVPGGVAVVPLPVNGGHAPVVKLGARRVMVIQHAGAWYALVGIALDAAPGDMTLDVLQAGAATQQVKFSVAAKQYPEQDLAIKNPEMVNPTPAQLRRIDREQRHLDKVVNGWRRTATPGVAFIWPAKGPETSGFGLRRVLNGEARSPHSGIDIGAPTGTPVHAPADAVVADVGRYYFCGKTLTLDMGEGLYSVYCHLSKIKVKPGQRVKQGQLVGKIGATGRTTGPNLHWTVRLNGAAVDPGVFLGANAPAPTPQAATISPPAKTSAAAPASVTAPAAATHS
ncbi:MAG TPA: peptidoglycan DD-metalloendopeptidase family protein [Gammaproteobacteria bacterium]|nr:peptidoglycan DD-metalloendopeptidase family protein [Gammaproteobacteria bacterium]